MESQITIKKIQDLLLNAVKAISVDDVTSRRMWWASLEVIQKEFLPQNCQQGGIWVSSPLPALNEKKFFNHFQGWLWSPDGFPYFQKDNAGFLPADASTKIKKDFDFVSNFFIHIYSLSFLLFGKSFLNKKFKIITTKRNISTDVKIEATSSFSI